MIDTSNATHGRKATASGEGEETDAKSDEIAEKTEVIAFDADTELLLRDRQLIGQSAIEPSVLLAQYENAIQTEETALEKARIPKYLVPSLPERFERTWLADIPDGAIASFRDMDTTVHSTHVHEFPGYWELHVDRFNPHYRPLEHALVDSEIADGSWRPFTTAVAGTVTTVDQVSDALLDLSGLGARRVRTVGESILKTTTRHVLTGVKLFTDTP